MRTAQDDAAAISTSPANAPDQRIDAQQSGKQSEQAKQSREPRIPAAAPATPAGDRPPADQPKPPDKRSGRAITWVRNILGGAIAVGVLALIGILIFSSDREPPPTTADTTSPASKRIVFQDDFASRANGWDDAGRTRAGGHYTNDAYRVFAEPKESTQLPAPRNAPSVYPSAPPSLGIEVDAKAFTVPEGTAYGLACRVGQNESGYLFTVGDDYVNISKYGIDGTYTQLSDDAGLPRPSGFKVNGTNRLEADCNGGEGDEAVSLVFRINGQVAAEATDTKDLLTAGTVALVAETYEEAEKAVEVEFDNFVVQA